MRKKKEEEMANHSTTLQERLEGKGILKPRPGGRAHEDQAQAKAEQLLREKVEQRMMGPKIKVRSFVRLLLFQLQSSNKDPPHTGARPQQG